MSGIGLAAGVIGMFFAAGIVAGVLIVALPRMRRRRRDMHQEDGWREPSSLSGDGPPRWPGA